MKIEPDEGCAEQMRALCDEILREHGPAATFPVVVSDLEGEARFLSQRLGPAVAYALVSAVADRIVERAAVVVAAASGGSLRRFLPGVFGAKASGPNGSGAKASGPKVFRRKR